MNISITATNLELTPSLKDYVEKRLRTIAKFTAGDPKIAVDIGKTSMHHRQGEFFGAKVIVITPLGKQYVASSEKTDLYEAIDDVRSEIVRELSSDKGRRITLFRRGAQRIKRMLRGGR